MISFDCSKSDQAINVYERVQSKWDHYNQTKYFLYYSILIFSPSLFKSMASAFGLPFCLAAGLKLIHDILQFIGPIMLQKVIKFLEDNTVPQVYSLHIYFILEYWLYLCCNNVFWCSSSKYLSS